MGMIMDFFKRRKLIKQLGSSDPNDRTSAAEGLGELKNPKALPALIEALKDEDGEVEKLIKKLKEPDRNSAWSSWNRREAAHKLGNTGDERAVEPLVEALTDTDSAVRESALKALMKFKDPRSVPALTDALKDEEPYMRWEAAWLLGEIQDARVIPALTDALRDEDCIVRANAAEALGRIAGKAEIDLDKVKASLHDYVKNAEEQGTAKREAAANYARIAAAIAKRKRAELGGELLPARIPKPPKGRMYRKMRRATA